MRFGGKAFSAAMVAVLFSSALAFVVPVEEAAGQGRPVIYLTYDDGPDQNGRTAGVLAALQAHGATATFFVLGAAVVNDPGTTQQIAAAGHALGNHTVTHPRLSDLTTTGVIGELTGAQNIINTHTGLTPVCFRPPYGATNSLVAATAAEMGLTQVLWDRAGWDWELTNPDDVLASIGPLWDGAVVLLHDTAPTVVEVTERLLEQYGATHDFRAVPACAAGATPPPPPTTTTVPPTTAPPTTAPPTTAPPVTTTAPPTPTTAPPVTTTAPPTTTTAPPTTLPPTTTVPPTTAPPTTHPPTTTTTAPPVVAPPTTTTTTTTTTTVAPAAVAPPVTAPPTTTPAPTTTAAAPPTTVAPVTTTTAPVAEPVDEPPPLAHVDAAD